MSWGIPVEASNAMSRSAKRSIAPHPHIVRIHLSRGRGAASATSVRIGGLAAVIAISGIGEAFRCRAWTSSPGQIQGHPPVTVDALAPAVTRLDPDPDGPLDGRAPDAVEPHLQRLAVGDVAVLGPRPKDLAGDVILLMPALGHRDVIATEPGRRVRPATPAGEDLDRQVPTRGDVGVGCCSADLPICGRLVTAFEEA